MHQLLLGLDQRGEYPQPLRFERPEIGYFRETATLAKPLQNLRECRLCGEPILGQAPHRRERGIEESEPLVGTIYGDGGADTFEHFSVRVDVAPQLGFCRLKVGSIEGEPNFSA